MPGNDLGDRVHNFFAQDNLSQGQHHSQVVEGNWPVLNSNFWAGSQRQVDQLSSNSKNYDLQSSDRGEAGYSLHVTNGLNLSQSHLRPDFARDQSLNEQPNLNGFMYAHQFHQTRQNEANFLGMDTGSDNLNLITSRGLLVPEVLPGTGTGHIMKASDRSEASVPPVSFDLFGGQQQMNHQQSSTAQSLLHQHSGINDIQQLQQQHMIRKLLQQQHDRQLDLRQQYLSSQVPSFTKQGSGTTLFNGTTNSDTPMYPWMVAAGTNWPNQGSSSMQGSPNGLGFPPNLGQTQGLVDMVPQQVDQSLYGVPVSSSRGLNMNIYSPVVTSRASIPQMPPSSNFLQGNQPNLLPEQVGLPGEFPMTRHKFQNDDMFGQNSKHSQNLGLGSIGGPQQTNSASRNVPRKESSQEKPARQVDLPQNEVALDPTEEKILFGSEDNIWAAFGKVSNVPGEAGNMFDNDGSNGLPSIQSGSWSALMQSAVAETNSSDVGPQEWSGLTYSKNDGPSWGQTPSFPNNSFKKETPLVDDSKRTPSALNSGSFPLSDDMSNNALTLNQQRQKFQNEPGQRLQTEAPQTFLESLGEADKLSKSGPLQNSIADRSQYRDASHPLQAEGHAKTIGFPGQAGTAIQSNGWNALGPLPLGADSVTNDHDAENLQQKFKNSQVSVIHGEVFHGSSLWKSNSVPGPTMELGTVKSRVSDPQANQRMLSLKDSASVDNSRIVGISDETSAQIPNNYSLNQWTNVHLSGRSQGGERLGRLLHQTNDPNQVLESMSGRERDEVARFELENRDVNENSNDSHHSNLSQHTFGRFSEGGVPEANDSRPLSAGKQKLANQLSRKVSAPRKFQYHPMGNVDEDMEPAYGLKQPSHVQTTHQKNAHFGQSKLFGQITRNSMLTEKGQSSELHRDIKGPDEEPSCGGLSVHVPNRHVSQSQPIDTLNNASSPSQNMLELFNRVDQSRNHGATMQLNSAEPSSQPPFMEKYDEFGRLQHSQSHASQSFGLQLGPPSQGLQIPDHPLSSQNGPGSFNSLCSNNATGERGGKSPQMVAKHSVQSLLSEEMQPEFKLNISTIPEHGKNESSLYKTPGKFTSSFSSGIDQNPHITRVSGQMPLNQQIQHIDSFSRNASYSAQRRTAEALLPGASGNLRPDNRASFGAMSPKSGPDDVQERVPDATTVNRASQQSSHHFAKPGLSHQGNSIQMLHNMGANMPVHKQSMSAKIQQISPRILELPQPKIVEASAPLMHDHVGVGQQGASLSTEAAPEVEQSSGKASILKHHLDDSPSSSTSVQKDIDAFGRSLKPNSFTQQNYSLLNQMQPSKDTEVDSSTRVSKKMKGLENVADVYNAASKAGQQHEHNNVLGDSLGSSRSAGLLQRDPSQDGNVASQDNLALNLDTSQNNSCINIMISPRVDHPQVSPQMAPSWFSQYGSLNNGKMLQPYDALKAAPLAHGMHSSGFSVVSSEENQAIAPVDPCQNSNNHENLTTSSVTSEGVSSLKSFQLNAPSQNLGILRPKKRKSAILDLNPWHKEISEVSQDHVAHSMTESDWDKASNCLADKVDDDAELIEDGPPVLRYKRRLILTTCLMQKLLHPAPVAILSADASTSYEALLYAVSRIALGDACSAVSYSSSLDVPCDSVDLHPTKGKLSVRNGVQCYAKAVEELLGRIRKLENDFPRLDKSASLLDMRLECQDLEKISVINRFARFHGRGQSDNTETSSTNQAATSQRPTPQRYVSALPLPRNIPDGVQCLPL